MFSWDDRKRGRRGGGARVLEPGRVRVHGREVHREARRDEALDEDAHGDDEGRVEVARDGHGEHQNLGEEEAQAVADRAKVDRELQLAEDLEAEGPHGDAPAPHEAHELGVQDAAAQGAVRDDEGLHGHVRAVPRGRAVEPRLPLLEEEGAVVLDAADGHVGHERREDEPAEEAAVVARQVLADVVADVAALDGPPVLKIVRLDVFSASCGTTERPSRNLWQRARCASAYANERS